MIKTVDEITTITCDKCGDSESEHSATSGKAFYNAGWTMNPRAKKYVHFCDKCKPAKYRRAHDFVIEALIKSTGIRPDLIGKNGTNIK